MIEPVYVPYEQYRAANTRCKLDSRIYVQVAIIGQAGRVASIDAGACGLAARRVRQWVHWGVHWCEQRNGSWIGWFLLWLSVFEGPYGMMDTAQELSNPAHLIGCCNTCTCWCCSIFFILTIAAKFILYTFYFCILSCVFIARLWLSVIIFLCKPSFIIY
jgi:hypothetical protein